MKKILLVEDEAGLLLTLTDRLESQKYAVDTAETGPQGLEKARNPDYDLILLDVMLPELDGFTVCKTLRGEKVNTPIIMLTAKSQLDDKVTGLKLGADDYVTKPFEVQELLARIEVQIRRGTALKGITIPESVSDNLIVNLQRGYISLDGVEQVLLAQEIKLLEFFYKNQNEVISRETLLETVWDYEGSVSTRTVDVHIARLRQKLGDTGDVPKYIQTIRGVGYKFIAP